MKQGLTLGALSTELAKQSEAKQDFLVDTRELTLLPQDGGAPELHLPNEAGEFSLRPVAGRQIGDHLKIPAKFWDYLDAEHQALLATNVNTLFRESEPSKRMVRCMDYGTDRFARAFLSDRYLRRDNADVAQAALSVLSGLQEVSFPTSQITETHMYITAVLPRLQADVKVDDTVQAGIRISNSEVGKGALRIEPIIYRLICLNGMTVAKATRVFHLGRQLDSDDTLSVLSQETEELDDRAFFAKLADVMRAAVDETAFNAIVAQMQGAAESVKMEKPIQAMEKLSKKYSIGEGESEGILAHLIEGGDLTAYGALNAVTRFAQDVDSYDRAMELEQVGGQILEISTTSEWNALAVA